MISLFLLLAITDAARAQNLLVNPDFESGTDSWFSFGPANLTLSGGGHAGSGCALVSMPNGTLPGIGQMLSAEMRPGQTYTFSAWLKISPSVPPPARTVILNLYYTFSSTNYIRPVVLKTLTTSWSEVSTVLEFNASGAVSNVMLGIDGFSPSTAFSFYVDDVSVSNSSPTLLLESANNSATLSWPATFTGYSLQRKATLSNSSSWTTATDPLQTNGGVIYATISATNASRFYRLKK